MQKQKLKILMKIIIILMNIAKTINLVVSTHPKFISLALLLF